MAEASPVLLVATVGGREIVVKRCPRAMQGGVREGRTLAEARAMLGHATPHVAPYDAPADAAALRSLAVFAERFAPTVAVDPPDGLLMDITGCERLFGGEDRLADAVRAGVERLGFHTRVAVAGTAGCAWALARYGDAPCTRVDSGTEHEALSPLPVLALHVAPATADALEELGLRTIGHLFPLPRDEVWARFGVELLDRLDRATGHASDPLIAVREAAPLCVERAFDGPVRDLGILRTATRLLLEALCPRLEAAGRGAMELRFRFRRADGVASDEAVRVSRASVDARHWLTLFESRLERLPPGDGIDDIRVTASRTRRLRAVQTSFDASLVERAGGRGAGAGDADVSTEVGRFVDTLVERCGAGGVVAFTSVESHWPERAFVVRPPFERAVERPGGGARADVPLGDRPSLLFTRPEEVSVSLDAHGRPFAVTWRGTSRGVRTSEGPERIAVPWWDRDVADRAIGRESSMPADSAASERNYYRVGADDGRWLWIFRRGARWFVHGEWA